MGEAQDLKPQSDHLVCLRYVDRFCGYVDPQHTAAQVHVIKAFAVCAGISAGSHEAVVVLLLVGVSDDTESMLAEDSVSGRPQGCAEPGDLRLLGAVSDHRSHQVSRLAEREQVGYADRSVLVSGPPDGHELSPQPAFLVCGLVPGVEVAEKALDAGGVQDASQDLGRNIGSFDTAIVRCGFPGSRPKGGVTKPLVVIFLYKGVWLHPPKERCRGRSRLM